ncbi:hypothetical protein ES705_20917 [subsurface metagenome]
MSGGSNPFSGLGCESESNSYSSGRVYSANGVSSKLDHYISMYQQKRSSETCFAQNKGAE